jgi:FMN phosphatase YigB (HAD superfamily)
MSRIRAVVFDFGGVLVEWRPELILARHYADAARRDRARREIFAHPDWLEVDRGTLGDAEALERFAARTSEPLEAMVALLDTVRGSLDPKPDSVALLRELVARQVPVYGLSNMSVPTYEWLTARHDFFGLFDGVVISAAVRLAKPDPAIYAHLCRTHGLVPESTLFVDDTEANVAAARALGFAALRFEGVAGLAAELERHGLR